MPRSLRAETEKMKKLIEDMRVQLLYMQFDLEATRREREYFKRLLQEKK